jgi:hypothetical protein
MSIGDIVYNNLEQIIDYCKNNPEELGSLLDIDKSKETFDLNYAFFIETAKIDDNDKKKSSARYIAKKYTVNDIEVRVTNDWYKRNIPYLKKYFSDRRIVFSELDNVNTGKAPLSKKQSSRKNSRYKGKAIGDSQNALIRNILSNLGDESFAESDWLKTKEYFGNSCAYCGNSGELVVEHAIPINR